MPYKVFPSGSGHKVWKVDEQGNKIGKPMSNKPMTEEEAKAQMQAMYANEKKPTKEVEPVITKVTWGEVPTEEIDLTDSDADKELTTKDYYGDPVPVVMVDGMGCCSLTFADLIAEQAAREAQYEMYELTDQFGRLSRNIMNSDTQDKAAALVALANEFATLAGEKVKEETAEDKSKSIAQQIAGDNQPESKSTSTGQTPDSTNDPGGDSANKDTHNLFIWKEAGAYHWLAAYSNNRRDDDNPPEIISTESHKEFDEALHKGEWPMPELWLWHIDYPVGVTQYHAYDSTTGFSVAAGTFNKGMEWAAEGVLNAGWDGVSHGMPSEWIRRDANDPTIIIRHRTKEITFLPPWAAANKLAFNIISKESDMAEEKGLPAQKRPEFVKAFGEERVTEIEVALADKAKEADEAGIEKKEAADETPAAEVLTPDNPVVKALEMVVTQLTALDSRLKAIEDKTQQVEAQLEKEQPFDLMEFLKSKSVIGQATAKVDGRSALAKDAPEESKQASGTQLSTGMRITLVDQLVGANEAWYQEKAQ